MNNINITKCKKCGHEKNNHGKFEVNPDFNNASDKELNIDVCKVHGCDCKFFEK
jgi:hypothetical protein